MSALNDNDPVSPHEFDENAKVQIGRLLGLVETFPQRFDRIEANFIAERAAIDSRITSIGADLGAVKARQNWLAGAHASAGLFIGFMVAHFKFW